jgi:5-methylcytosine-specific restriction endonuclease McrA
VSKGWKGGSSRAQRKQRAAVLRRDGGLCQLRIPIDPADSQDEGCEVYATHVHHKRGISVSGKVVANLDDLEAACARCNLKAGDPTEHDDPEPNPPRTRW